MHQQQITGDDVAVFALGDDGGFAFYQFLGLFVDALGGLDFAVHAAIWGLEESHFVDTGKGRHRADKSDVWTFRRFDRADTTVVRMVDVTDFEASAIAAQTTRSQCRQTTLVGQLCQWVGLIHELRQLRAAEPLADGRQHGADVDERVRRCRVGFDQRHTLFDDPLHAQQTDAELLLDELADGTHAAVAEVVDVVGLHARMAVVELDQALDDFVDVTHQQNAHVEARWVHGAVALVEVLVELVPTDLGQVVAALREEVRLEQRFCVVEGRWVTRAQALVELDECFFGVVCIVFVERGTQVLVLEFLFEGAEDGFDLLVVAIAGQFAVVAPAAFAVGLGAPCQHGTEQHGDGDFALAVDLD